MWPSHELQAVSGKVCCVILNPEFTMDLRASLACQLCQAGPLAVRLTDAVQTPEVRCQPTGYTLDIPHPSPAIAILHSLCSVACPQLEDDLLYKLSSAEGDMTEDVALIESLEESKRVADEISLKVAEAKTTEEQINEARDKVTCLHALYCVGACRNLERFSLYPGACLVGAIDTCASRNQA